MPSISNQLSSHTYIYKAEASIYEKDTLRRERKSLSLALFTLETSINIPLTYNEKILRAVLPVLCLGG